MASAEDFLPVCGKLLARELLNADEETVAREALLLAGVLADHTNERVAFLLNPEGRGQ